MADSLRGAMSMYGNGCRISRPNIDAGDLTGATAAAVSGSRSTSGAVMDLGKYRPHVASELSRSSSGTTRTDQGEVSDRREVGKDDVVATREVEVMYLFIQR